MLFIKNLPHFLTTIGVNKTQVIANVAMDNNNILSKAHESSIHTRASHSEQVSNIALQLLNKLPQYNFLNDKDKVKYSTYLHYTSILHDIGQPSYGHSLSNLTNEIIHEHFPNLYFDDNSNNIVFLEMYNLKRTYFRKK